MRHREGYVSFCEPDGKHHVTIMATAQALRCYVDVSAASLRRLWNVARRADMMRLYPDMWIFAVDGRIREWAREPKTPSVMMLRQHRAAERSVMQADGILGGDR